MMFITVGDERAGTIAELWPGGNLPPQIASLLRDLVWCDVLEQ